MEKMRQFRYVFTLEFLIVLSGLFILMGIGHTFVKRASFEDDAKRAFTYRRDRVLALLSQDAALLSGIVHSAEIKGFTQLKSPDNKAKVVERFINLAKRKPVFTLLRYIDENGQEMVRVENKEGKIQENPSIPLRDQSDKYYFTDTSLLDDDEIFLSPLDLNAEDGIVIKPFEPTMRIATPVFIDNERKGIVIVNIDAREQLLRLRQVADNYPSAQVYMVNSDGYFLIHPIESMEWGFMLAGKEKNKIQNVFPETWTSMVQNKEGVISNKDGFFLYTTLHPITGIQEIHEGENNVFSYFSKGLSVRDFSWTVFIRASLQQVLWDLFRGVMMYYILAFIAFVIFWLFMRRHYGQMTELSRVQLKEE